MTRYRAERALKERNIEPVPRIGLRTPGYPVAPVKQLASELQLAGGVH